MKFKIIFITLILLCISNLFPKAKTKEKSIKWSDYQGKMNWNDARTKCAEIGMRLPTREDGVVANKSKITNSWKKDGNYYWTADESNEVFAFYLHVDAKYFKTDEEYYDDKNSKHGVRCAK